MTDPETSSELIWGLAALEQRRQRTRNHLAKIAPRREGWITSNKYYYELLVRRSRFPRQGKVSAGIQTRREIRLHFI